MERAPHAGPLVLVVDDDPGAIEQTRHALATVGVAHIVTATSVADALARLRERLPDAIVLDLHLPDRSGLTVLEALIASLPLGHTLPVVAITNDPANDLRRHALELGAADVVLKPFDADELALRVRNQLDVHAISEAMRRVSQVLERDVVELTDELDRLVDAQLHQLRTVAILGGGMSATRMERVAQGAARLARNAGLGDELADDLRRVAALHDIGAIALPDRLLRSASPLTADERALARTHTIQGARLLGMGMHPLMQRARAVAQSHHERWDGLGYPHGLAGAAIPIEARVVAVVDTFEELAADEGTANLDQALTTLEGVAGHQLDPDLTAPFVANHLAAATAGAPGGSLRR